MIELLRRAAADGAAIVTDEYTRTYAELVAAAESIAAGLRARGIARFGILDHDAETVVTLLAAASLAGAEACQYPPTDDPTEVASLTERFGHDVVVTRQDVPFALSPDDVAGSGSVGPVPDTRPLLVLTTGTTGVPRGVRHDWARLLQATSRVQPSPGQRWLLAYGLHQFAGMQVLLHVFSAGATLIAPAPRRPHEGLAAMRNHGVECASATPTYWRFLLAEMRADGGPIPALKQITLGGEAIPGPLLEQLREEFPAANVSQVYAASEFGSTGSMRDSRAGLSVAVLERDESADVAMKIVGGELWVRSRTGMLGYYGEPAIDPDAWRPSGDLVEIVGDRILFRGRSSEVINVGGVKVHPLPIEERVGSVAGVEVARVFGRENALAGSIVAVEVVARPGVDVDTVRGAIRAACADLPAASRPRSIRFVDSLPMAGDKIVRRDV